MNQQPVEYADRHCSPEAYRSLARFLNVTEQRAMDLLADPAGYTAEMRSRSAVTMLNARSRLRRSWLPGYADPLD